MSQNLYVSNNGQPTFYALASLDDDWAIANFGAALVGLVSGFGELIDGVEALSDIGEISTVGDLINAIKLCAQVVFESESTGADIEDTQNAINAFLAVCMAVPDGSATATSVDVLETGLVDSYLTPAGVAGLMGAATVDLNLFMFEPSAFLWAKLVTPADSAWVATDSKICKAQPGHTFLVDTTMPEFFWQSISAPTQQSAPTT
jgi:hypothetical protein